MDGSVFRVLEGTSLSIEWPIVDSVYRNCQFDSSISIEDSNGNVYNAITIVHDLEDFVSSGSTVATSTSSFTDITTSIGDSESYTLIYTMTVDTISDSQSWDL